MIIYNMYNILGILFLFHIHFLTTPTNAQQWKPLFDDYNYIELSHATGHKDTCETDPAAVNQPPFVGLYNLFLFYLYI